MTLRSKFFVIISLFLSFLGFNNAYSQEIKAQVQIVAPRVQLANKQILTTLEQSIQQFINNRKWTEEKIEIIERLEISLFMEVNSISESNDIVGTVQLQVTRPVYNSTYKTTILQFNDEDVAFNYREFDNLDYQENLNLNDLTTLLAYYVYVSLGMDFDSYSEMGGNLYFAKAQTIVNLMTNKPGWNQSDGKGMRNRFYFAENLNSPRFKDFRVLTYEYHRKGLDIFYENPEKGRKIITESLQKLSETNQSNQNSLLQKLFFTTKWPELVEIYKGGTTAEKTIITRLLNDLDPTNSKRYEKIKE
jgi:hypothetical protein